MLVYWNAGQDGFWDPTYDGAGLDLASPLGFEPLIASDPYSLRTDVLNSLIPSEPALWLDPDPGVGLSVTRLLRYDARGHGRPPGRPGRTRTRQGPGARGMPPRTGAPPRRVRRAHTRTFRAFLRGKYF